VFNPQTAGETRKDSCPQNMDWNCRGWDGPSAAGARGRKNRLARARRRDDSTRDRQYVDESDGHHNGHIMPRPAAIVGMFLFLTFFGILESIYRINAALAYGEPPFILGNFAGELSSAYAAGFLFVCILPFARRNRFTRHSWQKVLPKHFAMLLVYSATHTFLMWAIRVPLWPVLGLGQYNYGTMRERITMEFTADIFAYAGFLAIAHGVWIYRESRERQLENLRLQLQPHFLFNSLNAISALVHEDPRRADEMIARLSELLRKTLQTRSATVPLAEEMETLELYLDMMQARFEEKFTVDLAIDPAVRSDLVPAFLLQPLVENAVKHGIDPRTESVNVRVSAERRNGMLHIEVSDNGPGSAKAGNGIGLANTAKRLDQIYGGAHRFQAANGPGGGFVCQVDIPCAS